MMVAQQRLSTRSRKTRNWARSLAWFRFDADIADKKMTVHGERFSVTYVLSPTGRLLATFGNDTGFGVMVRQSPEAITDPNTGFHWGSGVSEFLQTDFVENGQSVKLEAVVFRPPGEGPFPLAVVNHGSTGAGDDQAAFTDTWSDPWFAEILNARGWIVAFPQRRGRGKSGGLYDEGIAKDRSKGYTCDTAISLAGADRALQDLQAAVAALHKRPDVNAEPMLLAGHSRGGVLSIAYAGLHPEQAKGVINFVGGWTSDGCETADAINQTLFRKGTSFTQSTLWLYGKDDYFYSLEHSQNNFYAFRNRGGQGKFVEMTVRGENNGHWVMSIPPLWGDHVTNYLDELDK